MIEKWSLKSRGFFKVQISNMLPSPRLSFVEAKDFHEVSSNHKYRFSNTVFKIQRYLKENKYTSEEIAIWKGWGMTHTSHPRPVIEDNRGIIDRITIHESIYSFKEKSIVSFFGMAFRIKDANKHIISRLRFRKQNTVRGCFVLEFVGFNFFVGRQTELGRDLWQFSRRD